jgi:tetratricopeptide (TPR) repeat protein
MSGDKENAVADFDRAIALDPERVDYRVERGLVRLPELSPEAAIAELEPLVALAPDNVLLLEHRARLFDNTGEHDRALADYERAVARSPDDPDLFIGRARSYAAVGRIEDALADADRVVQMSPDHAFAHSMRAAYRDYLEGDAALVEADFDRSVALDPDDVSVRHHRGDWLRGQARYIEALVDYERALAVAPRLASAYFGRGICRSRLDEEQIDADEDWEEEPTAQRVRLHGAIADLERCIELGHREEDTYTELWNAHSLLDEKDAALAALDRGIAAFPGFSLLFVFREQQRRTMGDAAGADADHAHALELGFRFASDPPAPDAPEPAPHSEPRA